MTGRDRVSKDVIKERLFDGLGVDDLEWSRRLDQTGAAVLDDAWSSEHSPADLAGLGAPQIRIHRRPGRPE